MTSRPKKKKDSSLQQNYTGPCHEVTDLSKYSSKDQWGFIKSIKYVLNESTPPAMVSHLYPDSHHLFDNVETKSVITVYGKNWTFHSHSKSLRQVVIGRNCDNVLPDTIESHQLSLREGNLPIDIDLGPNKVVSRKHILIHKVPDNDNDWFLTILGRNSCKIDARKISNKRLRIPIGPLKSGTVLDIGDTQMMICFGNDPFPFLTLPYYPHLIPKLMTMYGLNGNNNPLLRDIINTSMHVKRQKIGLDRVAVDHNEVIEDGNRSETTMIEDNTIASSPKKQLPEEVKHEEEEATQSHNTESEVKTSDTQLTKKPRLESNITAKSFYTNPQPPLTPPSTETVTPPIVPPPTITQIKDPSIPVEKESLVRRLSKKHQESVDKNNHTHNNNNNNINSSSNSTVKRPNWPYTTLITRAILSCPEACLPLNRIYEYISTLHPFYDMSVKKWQNSVRHNLSIHDIFVKVRLNDSGSVWKLNDDVVQEFLENWYQGNLIKLKKSSGGVTKELCLFMSKETNKFPGQRDPQYYRDSYRKRIESEKKRRESGKKDH